MESVYTYPTTFKKIVIPFLLSLFTVIVPGMIHAQNKDSLTYDLELRKLFTRIVMGDALDHVNKEMTSFSLYDLDSVLITEKDLLGKPTVMTFWDPDCNMCKENLDLIRELHSEFEDEVHFISVSTDSLSNTKRFLEQKPLPGKILINGRDLVLILGTGKFPLTLILDKDTRVIDIKNYWTKEAPEASFNLLLCDPRAVIRSLL